MTWTGCETPFVNPFAIRDPAVVFFFQVSSAYRNAIVLPSPLPGGVRILKINNKYNCSSSARGTGGLLVRCLLWTTFPGSSRLSIKRRPFCWQFVNVPSLPFHGCVTSFCGGKTNNERGSPVCFALHSRQCHSRRIVIGAIILLWSVEDQKNSLRTSPCLAL